MSWRTHRAGSSWHGFLHIRPFDAREKKAGDRNGGKGRGQDQLGRLVVRTCGAHVVEHDDELGIADVVMHLV